MKVSLPQDQLSRALSIVGRGVASSARSTLPVTSNILLATDEHRLRLSATDDARPIFTGVLATFAGDKLTFAAADGFRLSVRSATLSQSTAGDFSVIIPARTLSELGRILPDGDELVEVTVSPNRSQVLFHTGSLDLISRLIEGQYVNYRQIIPQKYGTRAVVNTADWTKATRIASFFARDSNNIVRLSVDPGEDGAAGSLTIAANAADVGDNVNQIDADVEGEALTVAFNVKWMSDVLNVIRSGQVSIELLGPAQPGVVKPLDGTDYLHVIMPMSIPR